MGHNSGRATAVWTSYSDAYAHDIKRAIARIEEARKAGPPIERLVWRARSAYAAAWHNELRRTTTC